MLLVCLSHPEDNPTLSVNIYFNEEEFAYETKNS